MTGLDEAVARLAALAPPSRAAAAAALQRRVAVPRLRVLVAGEAKRGKSTLVNRLIGMDLLPTGAVPVTAVATTVVPDDRSAAGFLDVELVDGRRERRPVSDLAGLVTEGRNPGNVLGVREVRVVVASTGLPGLVELVDTPGTGSVWQHNTLAARAAYATLDAVVVVLTADPPASAADRELLETLGSVSVRTFVVVNKLDQVRPEDQAEIEAFTRRVCTAAGVGLEQVWFGSAREQDAGFRSFRETFVRYVTERARADAEQALVSHARQLQRALADDARLERGVLDAALSDGVGRVQELATRVDAVAADATRLDAECEVTERGLRHDLDQAATSLTGSLVAELTAAVASLGSAEEGRRLVEARTTPAVQAWQRVQHASIENRLTVLRRTVAERVAAQVGQMSSDALELLGVRLDAVPPSFALAPAPEARFDYEPGARWEGPAASLVREHAPGAAGRAHRRLLAELPGLVDRQVGRTRGDLQRALCDAVRQLRRQLATDHRERLDELTAVLVRARDTEVGRDESGAPRRSQLAVRLAALSEVGGRLTEIAQGLTGDGSSAAPGPGEPPAGPPAGPRAESSGQGPIRA
ncbi:dynamin family protein [Microlunatus antarcticus]|uniref:GTP-binding protein EngB required for normal cell division n=1 Tax=Microlunatus antarcticus TaxID=53388 RepID=A0A7W5JVC6_9ACTN|nr:GTP-binding protein EngB required for normal cell division [Microlunatus antarcticus]